MKLQLFLSHNGVCSRRKAFDLIKGGSVTVNGAKIVEPSTEITSGKDTVKVDGKTVGAKRYQYVLLNKPKGFVTTKSDPHAKRTVFDLLPQKFQHLMPAGRLDQDTEGLLVLTNDGDLSYTLTHPKFDVNKIYYVVADGCLDPKSRARLEKGMFLDGKRTAPAKIQKIAAHKEQTKLTITIHEGRKRQIRRMFAKVKHKVIYLKRTVQGPFRLGALKTGQWRLLTPKEIEQARKELDGHH